MHSLLKVCVRLDEVDDLLSVANCAISKQEDVCFKAVFWFSKVEDVLHRLKDLGSTEVGLKRRNLTDCVFQVCISVWYTSSSLEKEFISCSIAAHVESAANWQTLQEDGKGLSCCLDIGA